MIVSRIEDPLITELRKIVETQLAKPVKFIYANLSEANYGLDTLKEDEDFPVFVFLSNDKSKNEINEAGVIFRKTQVIGMLLNSIPNIAVEYTSVESSPYIEEMRQLGDNLIYNINRSSRTNPLDLIDDYTVDKIYGKFDVNLFGVGLSFTWSFNTLTKGC